MLASEVSFKDSRRRGSRFEEGVLLLSVDVLILDERSDKAVVAGGEKQAACTTNCREMATTKNLYWQAFCLPLEEVMVATNGITSTHRGGGVSACDLRSS